MQLFIYYLLLKECSAEPVKLFGLFYVDVPTRISDFKDQKVYLAKGMVKDDPSLMADFDPSHLQIKPSSGYNKFSDEAFQENFDIVKEKTEEAVNNILSLKMAQTPSIDSCRYCAFKEMCYSYQAREEMESSDDEEDDDDASK